MKKILIIEDDKGIATSLKLYLESSDFEIALHFDGIDAIDKIKIYNPDLIILDVNLPGKDGIEITKELREFSNIPIIMLTARTGELDRITGLENGADDYIPKPFSPRELLARINTIYRRVDLQLGANIKLGEKNADGIIIDDIKKTAFMSGNDIGLTSNEYEILKKLSDAKGGIITRESIMKEIIGYDKYLYDRTIDTHIKNLRKKIGIKDYILTVRGEGYRINI